MERRDEPLAAGLEAASELAQGQDSTEDQLPEVEDEAESEAVEQVANIRLVISGDKLEARLTLEADPPEPYPFTLEAVTDALSKQGIVEGILREELEEVVSQHRYATDLVVARGQRPIEGEDARIEYLFDPSPKLQPLEVDGKVDWREVDLIQSVVANQPVARKIPAKSGTPGITVTGKKLEPRRVRDVRLPVGRSTKMNENDPNELFAAVGGAVRLAGDQVVVDNVLTIPRDVDFSVGNIDFDGSVRVDGNVLPGFRVRATGDVQIAGYVEASTIESGGSVRISQGLIGQGFKRPVRAAKNVMVKFASNAEIYAGGEINIQWEALNCELESGNAIAVGPPGGRRGRIAGGRASAAKFIRTVDLGADGGTTTIVSLTLKGVIDPEEETKEITEQIDKLRDDHRNVLAEVAKLLQARQAETARWTAAHEQLLAKLTQAAEQIEETILTNEDRFNNAKKKAAAHKPSVVVYGSLFPGVRLSIGKLTRTFNETLNRVQVVATDDQQAIVSLGL